MKHGLSVDFLFHLHGIIVDKDNFNRAVKMFVDGSLPYDLAMGDNPINIAELRHGIAVRAWDFHRNKRAKLQEAMEKHKRIVDYYAGCQRIRYPKTGDCYDEAFIKDGCLVAFGHRENTQGGIFSANNEVMPDWRWNPHETLGRFKKVFVREIRKAAPKSPREWFKFKVGKK